MNTHKLRSILASEGLVREARVTEQKIRLNYVNLGDFGGTDPVLDSWVLSVAGPYDAMQAVVPTLKRYKFRWNSSGKSWELRATKYMRTNRKRTNFWNAARRRQEESYPVLKEMIDEINAGIEERNKAKSDAPDITDTKEFVRYMKKQKALEDALEAHGMEIKYSLNSKYSMDEPKILFVNAPRSLNPLFKRYGFRFGSVQTEWARGDQGWWLDTTEFEAVGSRFMQEALDLLG